MRLGDRLRVDGVDADLVDLLDVQHEVALLLEHLAALAAPQRLGTRNLGGRLSLLLDGGGGRGGVALLGEVDRRRLRLGEEVSELVHVDRREFALLSGGGRRRRFSRGGKLGLCYRRLKDDSQITIRCPFQDGMPTWGTYLLLQLQPFPPPALLSVLLPLLSLPLGLVVILVRIVFGLLVLFLLSVLLFVNA